MASVNHQAALPLSLHFSLVRSQPVRVWSFLAAAGQTSPPADAPPAREAAPAAFGRFRGGAALSRRAGAGELLEGGPQGQNSIHLQKSLPFPNRRCH